MSSSSRPPVRVIGPDRKGDYTIDVLHAGGQSAWWAQPSSILFELAKALSSALRPAPISAAPRERERTLLLYCPEQGGWQTGEWIPERECWVSTGAIDEFLEPTHWTEVPPEPEAMTVEGMIPVRLASASGRVLFNAPRLQAAWIGSRRDRLFEYADDLKLTPVQQPGSWHSDDHWIASRPMSDAEKEAFLREVEEDNRSVAEDLQRYAGRDGDTHR